MSVRSVFQSFAKKVATAIGSPFTFTIALFGVIVWASLGPVFQFSETWQLVINTSTTIITFLVVFLIQATQNRDSRALHLKLDELIHVLSKARTKLIDCEDLTEEELDALDREFKQMRKRGEAGRLPDDTRIARDRVSSAQQGAQERTVRARARLRDMLPRENAHVRARERGTRMASGLHDVEITT